MAYFYRRSKSPAMAIPGHHLFPPPASSEKLANEQGHRMTPRKNSFAVRVADRLVNRAVPVVLVTLDTGIQLIKSPENCIWNTDPILPLRLNTKPSSVK